MKENPINLSDQGVLRYLSGISLSKIVETLQKETRIHNLTAINLLQMHGFKKLFLYTVYKWIHVLGSIYDPYKKGLYFDIHEKLKQYYAVLSLYSTIFRDK